MNSFRFTGYSSLQLTQFVTFVNQSLTAASNLQKAQVSPQNSGTKSKEQKSTVLRINH